MPRPPGKPDAAIRAGGALGRPVTPPGKPPRPAQIAAGSDRIGPRNRLPVRDLKSDG
jgi:hypothetical protein